MYWHTVSTRSTHWSRSHWNRPHGKPHGSLVEDQNTSLVRLPPEKKRDKIRQNLIDCICSRRRTGRHPLYLNLHIIHIYSGITSGRVLNGEILYTYYIFTYIFTTNCNILFINCNCLLVTAMMIEASSSLIMPRDRGSLIHLRNK